jgi:hypothetical protein
MDPHEELALLRAHEPGLRPPQHHIEQHTLTPREHRARRHLASTLRRMANRLDG